jgi:Cobalamin-independent synthase, Catalytic domain
MRSPPRETSKNLRWPCRPKIEGVASTERSCQQLRNTLSSQTVPATLSSQCCRPPLPAACQSLRGSPSPNACGRMAPSGREPGIRKAGRGPDLVEGTGGRRHRHRHERRAISRPFLHGFLETIQGIDWARKTKMGIRADRYFVDVPTVTGPVRRTSSVHGEEVRFTCTRTKHQMKFTLPRPMTICDTIDDVHYPSCAEMAMAFAHLLNQEAREMEEPSVDVIQFDEPAFNVFIGDVKD